jgi:hypothetical protein
MWKKVVIAGLMMLAAAAGYLSNSPEAQIAYHKWRLAAAIENARTAGAGKPSIGQEFAALLGAEMPTAQECAETWLRHEEALVNLKYLARREFDIGKSANTEHRLQISKAAEKTFGGEELWSVVRSPINDRAIMVTARPEHMCHWEGLLKRLQQEKRVRRTLET